MDTLSLLLAAGLCVLAACKSAQDSSPPPPLLGRCFPMQYDGALAKNVWCQHQGFWWQCTSAALDAVCQRHDALPVEKK